MTDTETMLAEIRQAVINMRAALEFYANPTNYVTTSKGFAAQYDPEPPAVTADRGERARRALEPPA